MTETPETPEDGPGADAAFLPGLDDTAERSAVREPASPREETELDLERATAAEYAGAGRRRAEKSRLPGCLAVVVALAIIAGGGWFAWGKISDKVSGLGGSTDYSAGSTGASVTFEVHRGDTLAQIGRNLKAAGVVKSVDSFIQAASANPQSSGIQVGYYQLQKTMPASAALDLLVNPKNIVTTSVTIREGLRLTDIIATLAKKTGVKKEAFAQALKKPKAIGLPDYAKGNAEGYLFPATYAFGPEETATGMLKKMVARWKQAIGDNDVEQVAGGLECDDEGTACTPEQIMTVASLIQSEGRGSDMPKIGRVIYNRLQHHEQGTTGRLQIDATVLYALGRDGNSPLTTDEVEGTDSPYNTYQNVGLPPGPIGAPGDDAIQAALHPADGDWFYYVTVNLATGETKFASTYDEFLGYRAEYKEYCATESDRC